MTSATPPTAAVQRQTRTIPIVFVNVSDPVVSGIVAALNQPGGNITGFALYEAPLGSKWLELLSEIAPGLKRVAIMFNPNTAPVSVYMPSFETAALSLKVAPIPAPVHSDVEIEAAIMALGREPGGGFILMPDAFTVVHRVPITSAAARNNVPAVYWRSDFARDGGLLSYGVGLAQSGYVEGHNVSIEFRWPDAQGGTLQGAAADLARRRVAVIVASGAVETALAAKAASSAIPIVVAVGGDPVKYGLAASLNRPSGNITGVTFLAYALAAKRLSLLHDMIPQATTVAYLSGGSRSVTFDDQKANVLAAARELGMQVVVQEARSERDFEPAFAAFVSKGAGMLIVGTFTLFLNNREKIAALAAANKIPAIYPSAAYARVGGLMSYSAHAASGLHQAGIYVGQILNGAKPADLPIHLPTKFQFVINRNAANALGLAIPSGLLAQTEELIE